MEPSFHFDPEYPADGACRHHWASTGTVAVPGPTHTYIYIGSPPVVRRLVCCSNGGDNEDNDHDDKNDDGKANRGDGNDDSDDDSDADYNDAYLLIFIVFPRVLAQSTYRSLQQNTKKQRT